MPTTCEQAEKHFRRIVLDPNIILTNSLKIQLIDGIPHVFGFGFGLSGTIHLRYEIDDENNLIPKPVVH